MRATILASLLLLGLAPASWSQEEPERPGPARPGPARPGPARPGPKQPSPKQPSPKQPSPEEASRQVAQRGSQHLEAKRWAAGERDLRRALELWPANVNAANDLAWLLLTREPASERDPRAALPLARQATQGLPREAAYLDTLATALGQLGRPGEAAEVQARALRHASANLRPHVAQAQLRFCREASRRAADRPLLARALDLRGEARLLRWRAAAHEALGQRPQALRQLERAGTLWPLSGRDQLAIGRLAVALKRFARAEQALARAEALGAGGAGRERLRAAALRGLGQPAPAARAFERASAWAPGDPQLYLDAALSWRQAGQAAEVARVVSAGVAALTTARPLWPIRWRQRLRREEALAAESALTRAQRERDPAAIRRWRAAALRAWTLGEVARSEDRAGTQRLRALAKGERSLPARPLPLRRALARRFLGEEWARFPPLRFRRAPLPKEARGTRVAFADVDGDGDPDLLLGGSRLFLNDGRGRFSAGPKLPGGARGGVFADVDRDGDLDLFQCGGGPDRLLENRRGTPPRFVEWKGRGLGDAYPSEGAAWGDLNGDGVPDLYLANYETKLAQGTPDRLFLSTGPARWRDASAQVQTSGVQCGRGVSMADVDGDGDLDVFVSNYRLDRDFLWRNEGQGKLVDVAPELGVAGVLQRGSYGHTIGAAWGDLDLDGDLDLVAANLAHPRFIDFSDKTQVLLQGAEGRFVDAREGLGIAFEETHSHPTLCDFDADGDLDLFLTSVYARRPSFLYRNLRVETGRLAFRDETWVAGARVFNGWGAASADVDGDGDPDLVVCAGGAARLLLNDSPGPNRSLLLRLVGTTSDTWGAGARVEVSASAGQLVRELSLGHGTTCQSEPRVHLGLGPAGQRWQVRVRWPSGRVSRTTLGAGRSLIQEPE